jgi:hypothetical protein
LAERGAYADESWKSQQLVVVQQPQKMKGQLLLMPGGADSQKLVEAGNGGGVEGYSRYGRSAYSWNYQNFCRFRGGTRKL